MSQILKEELSVDYSTTVFLQKLIELSAEACNNELVALMRQAVLFISKHSKTESVFILEPLIDLCCLENQDR